MRLIVIRGAGDIATACAHRLFKSGFAVVCLEAERPSAIRRGVAFSEAVYERRYTVEGVECVLAENAQDALGIANAGAVALLIDPRGESVKHLRPYALIDAILAKRNTGTTRDMAQITIGLGPGFSAPRDVTAVIETMRGHNLGRIITDGAALANTGIPGAIGGFTSERVVRSPAEGEFCGIPEIGDIVRKGDLFATVGQSRIFAPIDGVVRGILRSGHPVTVNFKCADIDPRVSERENCFTISDKARCIAGSVLESVLP